MSGRCDVLRNCGAAAMTTAIFIVATLVGIASAIVIGIGAYERYEASGWDEIGQAWSRMIHGALIGVGSLILWLVYALMT